MAYTVIPTRTNNDANSSADINQLMENIGVVKQLPALCYYGLNLSNAADTEHDITVNTGCCVDSTLAYIMILSTAITKRIDAGWSAGTNAGGLDTGNVGNTTEYFVWLIRKDSDGTIDALISASSTAPTMPAGYTYKKLLRGIRTDGSANIVNNQWLITDVTNDRSANLIVYDQKAKNTAGDAYAAGAWRTRVINTVNINEIPGASLASNQVTLPAGTYRLSAKIIAAQSGTNYSKWLSLLYNATATANISLGMVGCGTYADGTNHTTFINCEFTIASSSALELRIYPVNNLTGGTATNVDVETYLHAHFQKIG